MLQLIVGPRPSRRFQSRHDDDERFSSVAIVNFWAGLPPVYQQLEGLFEKARRGVLWVALHLHDENALPFVDANL